MWRFASSLLALAAACGGATPASPAPSQALAGTEAPSRPPSAVAEQQAPRPATEASSAPEPPPPTPAELAADPSKPLPEPFAAALAALRDDPPPRAITRNEHYLVSDERKPFLFRDAVQGLGGVVLGVGAEQNWLLAGWARAAVLVLTDFDQWVVDLNRVHALLIEVNERPRDYHRSWSEKDAQPVRELISSRWSDAAEAARVRRVFDAGRGKVYQQLSSLLARQRRLGVTSYLDDQAEYDHLRRLVLHGRVRSVRGNLLGTATLADVAAFARQAGLPVRVLYLSNAEGYFDWSAGAFRDNVRALPHDERSLVLSTKPHHGTEYRYVTLPYATYVEWLGSRLASKHCELFDFAERVEAVDGSDDRWVVQVGPSTAPAPPARRCRKY